MESPFAKQPAKPELQRLSWRETKEVADVLPVRPRPLEPKGGCVTFTTSFGRSSTVDGAAPKTGMGRKSARNHGCKIDKCIVTSNEIKNCFKIQFSSLAVPPK